MRKSMKEAIEKLAKIGITINFNANHGEYRVNFIGGKEATAYYTSDLQDAMDTGREMAKHRRKEPSFLRDLSEKINDGFPLVVKAGL